VSLKIAQVYKFYFEMSVEIIFVCASSVRFILLRMGGNRFWRRWKPGIRFQDVDPCTRLQYPDPWSQDPGAGTGFKIRTQFQYYQELDSNASGSMSPSLYLK